MSKVTSNVLNKVYNLYTTESGGARTESGIFSLKSDGNLIACGDNDGYWYNLDELTIYAKFNGNEYVIKLDKKGKKGTFVYPSQPVMTIELP